MNVENPPDSWRYSSCFRPPCCLPPRPECECVQAVDNRLVDARLFVRLRFPMDRLISLVGQRVVAVGYYYEVIGPDPWVSAAIIEARYLCPQ